MSPRIAAPMAAMTRMASKATTMILPMRRCTKPLLWAARAMHELVDQRSSEQRFEKMELHGAQQSQPRPFHGLQAQAEEQ